MPPIQLMPSAYLLSAFLLCAAGPPAQEACLGPAAPDQPSQAAAAAGPSTGGPSGAGAEAWMLQGPSGSAAQAEMMLGTAVAPPPAPTPQQALLSQARLKAFRQMLEGM